MLWCRRGRIFVAEDVDFPMVLRYNAGKTENRPKGKRMDEIGRIAHPEELTMHEIGAMREADGVRTPDEHVCVSSDAVLARVTENAAPH